MPLHHVDKAHELLLTFKLVHVFFRLILSLLHCLLLCILPCLILLVPITSFTTRTLFDNWLLPHCIDLPHPLQMPLIILYIDRHVLGNLYQLPEYLILLEAIILKQ